MQWTFFLNTNWRTGGHHGNNGFRPDVVPALGIQFLSPKISPSKQLIKAGERFRKDECRNRRVSPERALPLKINFSWVSRVVNLAGRKERAWEFQQATGRRRAKSVVIIIVMGPCHKFFVTGNQWAWGLLHFAWPGLSGRRPENKATGFIALFRACLIEYDFTGATQTSQLASNSRWEDLLGCLFVSSTQMRVLGNKFQSKDLSPQNVKSYILYCTLFYTCT